MTTMRAKLVVESVLKYPTGEVLKFRAVSAPTYPHDGVHEDNNYSKFTPNASLELTVTNPALLGQFNPGDKFYVDFTPVE